MSWLDDDAGHVFTVYGAVPVPLQDTVIYKFTPGALQFPASGLKALRTPDSTDFAIGSNSFAIDFWIYPDALPSGDSTKTFCGHGRLGSVAPNMTRWEFWLQYEDQNLKFYSVDGSNTTIYNITSSVGAGLTLTSWQHLAICANQNGANLDFRFFKDGTQVGTTQTVASVSIPDPEGLFCVGTSLNLNNMQSRIDEFRFSIGTARWTSNFTPPSSPYTLDEYTKVLMHYGAEIIAKPSFCTVVMSTA